MNASEFPHRMRRVQSILERARDFRFVSNYCKWRRECLAIISICTMKAVQQEAAQALAYMARDAIGEYPNGPLGPMAIEVRDDSGPVLKVKFQFSIGWK